MTLPYNIYALLFAEYLFHELFGIHHIFFFACHFEIAEMGDKNDGAGHCDGSCFHQIMPRKIYQRWKQDHAHKRGNDAGVVNEHQGDAYGDDGQEHPGLECQNQTAEGCQTLAALKVHGYREAMA